VFRYHIGTIVYHTFVTSFCTLIQIILGYIYNTLKNAKQYSNVARFSMAFFQCHLRVYQKYFRYLSKHNLIQVAMWSDDYITAGQKQYFLLWRNRHRVIKGGMQVDKVSTFLLKLCQTATGFVGFCVVYWLVENREKNFLGYEMKFVESPMFSAVVSLYVG